MTAAFIPSPRHPAEAIDDKKAREAYPNLWVCPTCKDPVRVCDNPACIAAEIDDDFRQSLDEDNRDD